MFLNSPVGLSVGGFAVNRSPLTAGSRDSHTEVKKNNQYVRSQAAESPVDDEVASQRGLLGEPALRCPKLMQSRSPLSFFSEPPTNSACSFLSQQENSDGQQFPLPRTSNVFQVPKFTLRAGLQDFETRIAQREQQWRALVGDDEEEGDEDGNNKNALEREQEHHQGPYYNIIDDEEVEDQQVVGSQQGRGYVEELGYYEDVKDWDEDYGAENREAVDRELEAEIDRVQQHVIQWTRPAASARKPVAASTRRRAGRGGRQDCFSKITVGSLNTSSTSSTLAQAGRVTTSRSSAGRRSRKNSKNNAPLLEHQQARATVGSSGRARSTAEEQKRFYRLLASREMVEQGAVEELPYRKLSSAARASSMKAGTRRAEDETVNLKSRAPSMIAAPNPQVEDTTTQGLKMNDETPNSAVTRRADEALGLSSRVLEPSPRLDFTAAAFTSPRFRKDGLSFFQPPARQVDLQLLASEKPNVLKAGMKQPAVQEALSASSSSTAASGGPPTSGNASALSSRRSSDATVASTVQPGALTQLITKSLEQLHVNCEGLSNISSNANLYTLSSSSSSPVEEKAAAAEMNDGEVLEVDLNVNVLEVAAGSPHLHVVESQDDDRGARLHGGRGTRAPRATGDQRRRPPSSSSRARSPLRLAGVASAKRRSRIPPGGGNDASVSTFHRSGSTTRRDQMVFGSLYADAQRRQNLAAEREQQRLAEELGLDKEDVEAGDNGEQLRLAMSARCTRAGSSVPGNMPASLQLRSSSVQPSLRNASRARSDRSRPEKGSVSASSSKKSTRSRTRSKDDNASNDDDRGQERQSCQKTHLEREAEFAEKRRLWREEAKARADRDREERELAECTFRPRREGPPPRFSPLSARGRNEGARSNQGPQLDIEQDVQQRERFSPGRGSTNKADRRPHRDFREDRMVALLRAGGAVFGDVETEGTRITIDSTPGPEVVRMAQPSVRVGMKRPMPQFVYYSEQAGVGTRRAVTEDAVLLNERTANDQVEGLSPSSKVHPETITRGGKKYTLDRAEGSTFPVSFLQSKRPTTSCSSAAREALVAGTAGTTIAASTVKPAIKTAREQALLAAAMGFDGNNIDQILRMINVNLVTTAGQTRNNERESVEQGPPSASKEQQQRVALGGATTTRVSSSSNTRTPPVSADAFLSTTDEPRDAVKRNLTDQFLSVEEKTRSPDRYVFQEEDRLGCSASSSAASNDPQDRFFCPSSASSNDATTRTSCSNNPSPAGTSSGTTGTTAISTKRNNSKRRFPLPQAKAVVSFEDEVVHMQNKASPRPNSRPVMQDGEVLEALGLRKNARIKGGDSNLVDNSSSPESENTFHTGTSNSSDNSRTTTTTGHSSCLLKPLPHQIKKLRWITSSTSSSEEETEEQTAFSYRTNGTSNNSTSWKTGTEVTTSAAASPGTTGNMMDLFETAIRSRVGTTGASTETKYNMNTFAFS